MGAMAAEEEGSAGGHPSPPPSGCDGPGDSAAAEAVAPLEAPAPEVAPGASEDLHVVCWNVAGWKRSLEQIKKFNKGLSFFVESHHADILCLQETKLSTRNLTDGSAALGADLPGYDSFWACNDGGGVQRAGLNGVATFARTGSVRRADPAPLGDPELDSEGRCLLTDHGAFVIFNVYVPNSAGGPRLPYKLRWLRRLREAMQRERKAGKAVILAGDLNARHRAQDCHWSFRRLTLTAITGLAQSAEDPEVREAASSISQGWPAMCTALREKECRELETRNSRNGQTFRRCAVWVKSHTGESVRLGPPFEDEDSARGSFQVQGSGCEADGSGVRMVFGAAARDAAHTLGEPDELAAWELFECVKKILGLELQTSVQQRLSDAAGQAPAAPAVRQWLQAVLKEDGMVDSFVELFPQAVERFTCWDQYRNRRHENLGSRIDHLLVDEAFCKAHAREGLPLFTGVKEGAALRLDPNSAAAALAAATLGGLSRPSPFEGGGMPPLEEEEYLAHFRGCPSSGILYTPPQLSDHVAVSLYLAGVPTAAEASPPTSWDAATKRCQPHRAGKRITDFFGQKRAAGTAAEALGAPAAQQRRALGASVQRLPSAASTSSAEPLPGSLETVVVLSQ